ncbi:uncharacterized protein ACBR49_006104 [Aulostomus maculatus]
MGNCTSRLRGEKEDNKRSADDKAKEEVMYASIDHINTKGSRRTKLPSDDNCDYSVVVVGTPWPRRGSDASSKDDCTDDYVLMS